MWSAFGRWMQKFKFPSPTSPTVCANVRLHDSLLQLEELRAVPASSEKAIADATARKEELEKQKVKEEEKLKEVMESLKEETSGLQQDKEVRTFVKSISCYVKT